MSVYIGHFSFCRLYFWFPFNVGYSLQEFGRRKKIQLDGYLFHKAGVYGKVKLSAWTMVLN